MSVVWGSDRRQRGDRRVLPTRTGVHGGRRASDPDPSHGTYARYKRGCRCTPCRAANAAAEGARVADARKGKRRLAQRVSAVEAQRLIRLTLREGYTRRQLAALLGLSPSHFGRLMRQRTISVGRSLTVELFYAAFVADVDEGADHGPEKKS